LAYMKAYDHIILKQRFADMFCCWNNSHKSIHVAKLFQIKVWAAEAFPVHKYVLEKWKVALEYIKDIQIEIMPQKKVWAAEAFPIHKYLLEK